MKFSSTKETPEVEGDPRQCGLFGFLDNVEILVSCFTFVKKRKAKCMEDAICISEESGSVCDVSIAIEGIPIFIYI